MHLTPILRPQPGYSTKLPRVGSDEREVEGEGMACDEQVIWPDRGSRFLQLSPQRTGMTCRLGVERHFLNHCEELAHLFLFVTRIARLRRSRKKLKSGNGADRTIIRGERLELVQDTADPAKEVHASVRIEEKDQSLELRNWRKATLIGPSKTAVRYPDTLEKISRPLAFRFRFDDDRAALLMDKNLGSLKTIFLGKSHSLRTASGK